MSKAASLTSQTQIALNAGKKRGATCTAASVEYPQNSGLHIKTPQTNLPSNTHATLPRRTAVWQAICMSAPPTSRYRKQPHSIQVSSRKNTDPAATKWGWKKPISSGGSWCAGSGATGKHLTCKMSVVCHVTPRVITSYGRRCYSPSSLSNTIVLRNEESFPGRSVLGSRRLHRSVCSELSPGNGFETRG